MDVFTWSIPFVSEKVTEILMNLLKPNENGTESDEEKDNFVETKILAKKEPLPEQKSKVLSKSSNCVLIILEGEILKSKIIFVSKMMKFNKTIRENSEEIMQLKGLCPDKKIPRGILTQGKTGIDNAIETFEKVKIADKINEMRPTQDTAKSAANMPNTNNKKLF